MGQISYGEKIQGRMRRLLAALLDYVNHDIEDAEHLDIDYNWQGDNQLVVRTKLRILEELTAKDSQPGKLTTPQIREAIKRLEDFAGILTDNRAKTQGTHDWHFTLKLRSRDKWDNLSYFDEEWRRRKAEKESSTDQVDEYNRNSLRNLPNQNLPSQINEFIGREEELKELLGYIDLSYRPPYINVCGIGGVGKTALVVEAAYRCWEFKHGVSTEETPVFDAIIFTEAKKSQLLPLGRVTANQREVDLEEIFREIANTLDDQSIIRTKPENRQKLVQKKLGERNTLLIVDNFETIQNKDEVLSFLNDLPPKAKGVITSREKEAGFRSIKLDSLPEKEGIQLIQQQAEEKGVSLTEEEYQQIYHRFSGVPVALIYVVGQLTTGYQLDDLLHEKILVHKNVTKFCFESSVQPLRGTPPHQLLMSLAIFPYPSVREAIAEVAGLPPNHSKVADGLAQLQQLSLISLDKKRYTMLSLTREYVLDELADNPDFAEEARDRWVTWYLKFAQKYGGEDWHNGRNYHKLKEEEENLRKVLRWCFDKERYEEVRDLWENLYHYTSLYGYWHDRLDWLNWVREKSKNRREWSNFVQFTIYQSWTLIRFKSPNDLKEAEEILAEVEPWENDVNLLLKADLAETRAKLHIRYGEYDEVRKWLDQELKLVQEANLEEKEHLRYSIPVSYHRAEIYFLENNYEKSKEIFHQTLEHAKIIQWERVISSSKNWLADIAIKLGDLEKAENLLTEGIKVAHDTKNKRREARYHRSFARLERARGNFENALKSAKKALELFRALAMDNKGAGIKNEAKEMKELI